MDEREKMTEYVKDPGHSPRSAGGRLHLNKHTPLTKRSRGGLVMLPKHSVGTYQGKELTCNWLGNARPQLSQHAEPLWTAPGPKNAIGARGLSPLENKNKNEIKECAGGQ